jgi:hypothetical protein
MKKINYLALSLIVITTSTQGYDSPFKRTANAQAAPSKTEVDLHRKNFGDAHADCNSRIQVIENNLKGYHPSNGDSSLNTKQYQEHKSRIQEIKSIMRVSSKKISNIGEYIKNKDRLDLFEENYIFHKKRCIHDTNFITDQMLAHVKANDQAQQKKNASFTGKLKSFLGINKQ